MVQFPADVYLDHRRLSWVLAEELGAVHFLPPAGIVLVHRKRAENIAAALLGGRDVLMLEDALALPARIPPEPVRMPRLPAAGPSRARTSTPFSSPAACCASPRGGPSTAHYQAAADDLAALWREHEAPIRAAAGGREPWCARWLREHRREETQDAD